MPGLAQGQPHDARLRIHDVPDPPAPGHLVLPLDTGDAPVLPRADTGLERVVPSGDRMWAGIACDLEPRAMGVARCLLAQLLPAVGGLRVVEPQRPFTGRGWGRGPVASLGGHS